MSVNEAVPISWQGPGAGTFVAALNARWKGQVAYQDPWTVIESVELLDAPIDGPMQLRMRFTMEGVPGVWDLDWDDAAWRSLPDAVTWFGQVVWETFAEVRYTSYRPDGFRLVPA